MKSPVQGGYGDHQGQFGQGHQGGYGVHHSHYTMFIYTLQEKNALSLLITSHCNQYLQGCLKINNWGGGGGGGTYSNICVMPK